MIIYVYKYESWSIEQYNISHDERVKAIDEHYIISITQTQPTLLSKLTYLPYQLKSCSFNKIIGKMDTIKRER